MVRHIGLKFRMVVMGSILFAFYAAIAGLVIFNYGANTTVLALLLLGTVGFVGFQYKFGKWAALRSVGAEDMPNEGRYREIHQQVEQLSRDMGIDKPRLMVADMGVPNAFAVGRKGAGVVVVSTEIIDLLEREELEGVLAHELAHISNRDVVMMLIGQSIAAMVGIVVQFAVLFGGERNIASYFFAMIAGSIAQMLVSIFVLAISRYREYVADSDAAQYTNNPDAMARALEKISEGAKQRQQMQQQARQQQRRGRGPGQQQQRQQQGTPDEVAALCIFEGDRGVLQTIFATHPPVEKRISKLRSM
ncbi:MULTISPECIES: M48 family metallopeptidase [Salinibaculum]|uniref:M48 family metallopeptidase n=1 Tax=Salinibaculum TaxID=2732368 RepID=UPI0030CE58F3